MAEQRRVLLPKDIQPQKYRLILTPDLLHLTFQGTEEAEVDILTGTSHIVLHSVDLRIQSVELRQNDATVVPIEIRFDETRETVTFEFDTQLHAGPAKLKILFAGDLSDKMRGFYRSDYTVQGEIRTMAVTHFEATNARRAFPCWDEPAIRAVFDVTLVTPPDRIAISNMPVVETSTNEAAQKVVRFAETPPMSTYLLAFIVGEFDCVEDTTPEGVHVRVFTPLGRKERGCFALSVATRSLSYFSQYFSIPHPLPKIDLIAIPDFAGGAMENWGAVTFRETAVLVDPEDSAGATRQRVALVVAHELAHSWFGNLVTIEWWTHLWLKEGFASWIAYLAVDYLFPEWDIWTQFVFIDFGKALRLDSLRCSHPIEIEVKDANEIGEIFDDISYSKGASVIRMVASFLGEEIFRQGLQLYLTRHEYSAATTEDLWSALANASGTPVKLIMDSWTKQVGYPVIFLDGCDQYRELSLSMKQARFFLSGAGSLGEENKSQWCIPLSITTLHSADPINFMLQDSSATFTLPLQDNEWVKVNSGQTSFFRVVYSSGLLARLIPAIEALSLPSADRLGIQNDAFALARAGLLSATQVLDLIVTYKNEVDYTVWADLSTNLKDFGWLLFQEPSYNLFRVFGRTIYRRVAKHLGWTVKPEEKHLTTLLRGLVLGELGAYGDEEIIHEAQYYFSACLEGRLFLHPDLRFPVYRLVVENGGVSAFEAVLKMFREAGLQEEKMRCLRALGYSQQPELLRRSLELSLSNEVRSQDSVLAIESVAANRYGIDLAWHFLQHHWNELYYRYGNGGLYLLRRLISSTTENFVTKHKADEVEEFFRLHPAPAADRAIRQSLERIQSNFLWLQRDQESVQKWLEDYAVASH